MFYIESTSLSLCCYALACRANVASTLQAVRTQYYLWRTDLLKLQVIGRLEPFISQHIR